MNTRGFLKDICHQTYKGHCLDGIDPVVSSEKYGKSIVNVWDLT